MSHSSAAPPSSSPFVPAAPSAPAAPLDPASHSQWHPAAAEPAQARSEEAAEQEQQAEVERQTHTDSRPVHDTNAPATAASSSSSSSSSSAAASADPLATATTAAVTGRQSPSEPAQSTTPRQTTADDSPALTTRRSFKSSANAVGQDPAALTLTPRRTAEDEHKQLQQETLALANTPAQMQPSAFDPIAPSSSPTLVKASSRSHPPAIELGILVDRSPASRPQSDNSETPPALPTSALSGSGRPGQLMKSLSRGNSFAPSAAEIPKLITLRLNEPVVNAPPNQFPTNFIRTSKYTILTFLPVNLFEQFRRIANQYFLLVVVLQTIPGVSPFPIYTSLAPLIFILAIGALNEAREDVQRHRADNIANSRPCLVSQSPTGVLKAITSAVVHVGDILRIEKGQEFPADLILLHSAREDGTCYVNTANLDGEAAPKVRTACNPTQLRYSDDPSKLVSELKATVQYETPNASLYRFQGTILLKDPETDLDVLHPLGDKQLLLRGARLVNTAHIYGLVVYTGVETKMMLNRNPARFKFSHFEMSLNKFVLVCLALNFFICLIPSLYYVGQNLSFARNFDINQSDGLGWLLGFITLYILFSFMVPQSLYVTIELVKVGQARFMEWDSALTWSEPTQGAESGGGESDDNSHVEVRRCAVKASALNEELGAVDVICADKTGTLTSNQMELTCCTVGGRLFFESPAHLQQHHNSLNQQQQVQDQQDAQSIGTHKLMKDLAELAFKSLVESSIRAKAEAKLLQNEEERKQKEERDREREPDGLQLYQTPKQTPMHSPLIQSPATSPFNQAQLEMLSLPPPLDASSSSSSSSFSSSSSSTSFSSPDLLSSACPPATAHDFLLTILLCNNVLPSWKLVDRNPAQSAAAAMAAAVAASAAQKFRAIRQSIMMFGRSAPQAAAQAPARGHIAPTIAKRQHAPALGSEASQRSRSFSNRPSQSSRPISLLESKRASARGSRLGIAALQATSPVVLSPVSAGADATPVPAGSSAAAVKSTKFVRKTSSTPLTRRPSNLNPSSPGHPQAAAAAATAAAARQLRQKRLKRLVFESQSPDEIALLQALQRIGVTLVKRSGNKLKFDVCLNHDADKATALAIAQSKAAEAQAAAQLEAIAQAQAQAASQPLTAAASSSSTTASEPHTALTAHESQPLMGTLKPRPALTLPPTTGDSLLLSIIPPPASLPPMPVGPERHSFVYTVLASLEFSSSWRRNSVVVRGPDGSLKLLTKGADTTIAPLIDISQPENATRLDNVMRQATQFANSGSRTLLFSSRNLSQAQFDEWWPLYDAAQNAFNDRESQIERAFYALEKNMTLLGCSSVDDQLQEHVPATVDFLLAASLQIIVLTGDKAETATTIAKQAHLIKPNAQVLHVAAINPGDVKRQLTAIKEEIATQRELEGQQNLHPPPPPLSSKASDTPNIMPFEPTRAQVQSLSPDTIELIGGSAAGSASSSSTSSTKIVPKLYALVIDGIALELALIHHKALFLTIFASVETVVSFRSTPMQKALVVKLMKDTGKVVLAIGDGANDIQESHVGIGLLGKEGAHAAMSADFVLQRFHHLKRLLVVHGRNNYFRTAQVVKFSFYKNLAFPLPLFWYCFYSQANGTAAYDALLMTAFNTFFTSLPPFFAGLFERDLDQDILLRAPQAFHAFKVQSPFTVSSFGYTLLSATWQSLVFYYAAHLAFWSNGEIINSDGRNGGLGVFGNLMMSAVVCICNVTMLVSLSSISIMSIVAFLVGILLFLIVFVIISEASDLGLSYDALGVGGPLFSSSVFWLYLFLCLVACLLPNFIFECWRKLYHPAVYQQLQAITPYARKQFQQQQKQQDAQEQENQSAEQQERQQPPADATQSSNPAPAAADPAAASKLPSGVTHFVISTPHAGSPQQRQQDYNVNSSSSILFSASAAAAASSSQPAPPSASIVQTPQEFPEQSIPAAVDVKPNTDTQTVRIRF